MARYFRFRFTWSGLDFEVIDGSGSESGFDTSVSYAATPILGARHMSLRYTRNLGAAEDDAYCHFDWLNMTDGAPDDTWDNDDYAQIETAVGVWMNAIKSNFFSGYTLSEARWYKIDGIAGDHPVVRTASFAVAGTSAGALPPQVSLSMTFMTNLRKRWGRTYLPGLAVAANDATKGRPTSATITAIRDATATLMAAGDSRGIAPIVYSPTTKSVYSIEKLRIDDTWDIIRSRRQHYPTIRSDATLV